MMLPETFNESAASLIMLAAFLKRKNKCTTTKRLVKKKKSNTSTFLNKRKTLGQIPILNALNEIEFLNYVRMDRQTFQCLLEMIKPLMSTRPNAVSIEERLSLTLRYLASGNSFSDLKFLTAISSTSIRNIIMDTCIIINQVLKDCIKLPENEEQWRAESNKFFQMWNFPHCIGAMDGKHVHITKPKNSGDLFLNYKGRYSIILMAVVNANKEFLMVDVGVNGRCGDAGLLRKSAFYSKLMGNKLNIPAEENLPNSSIKAPYVFIGDSAFPLQNNILKPYPFNTVNSEEIIYNQRHSRARCVVENAFGILAMRFRILNTTINLTPDKVKIITLTCCFLHNFLVQRKVKVNHINSVSCSLDKINDLTTCKIPKTDKIDPRSTFKASFAKK